jgi:hypothetical protein
VVGGATVARIRRPLPRKAAVAADMVRLPPVTHVRHRVCIAAFETTDDLRDGEERTPTEKVAL